MSGDFNRLQQVVWNLISNAVKFSPAGKEIEVQLKTVAAQVQIVVKDNGQGISADFLPHVFERFRQRRCQHNQEVWWTRFGTFNRSASGGAAWRLS